MLMNEIESLREEVDKNRAILVKLWSFYIDPALLFKSCWTSKLLDKLDTVRGKRSESSPAVRWKD